MNKRTVYITSDKKITVLDRRCVEVALPDPEDLPDGEFNAALEYLRSHSDAYPHTDLIRGDVEISAKDEAFLWVPPTEDLLEETYKDAPQIILDAVRAAFVDANEKGGEDYGYVLIGFF